MKHLEMDLFITITSIAIMIANVQGLGIFRMTPEELLGLPNNEPASVLSALSRVFHTLIKQHSHARESSLKAHQLKDAQSALQPSRETFGGTLTIYYKNHQSLSSLISHPLRLLTILPRCVCF